MKAIATLLILLGLFIQSYSKKPYEIQGSLKDDYVHFNNGYFDGKLPDIPVVYKSVENADIGDTTCQWTSDGDTACSIFVNAYYDRDEREADMTLLHEMCHVAVTPSFDQHGPVWQNCMHNLANAGAFDNLW